MQEFEFDKEMTNSYMYIRVNGRKITINNQSCVTFDMIMNLRIPLK